MRVNKIFNREKTKKEVKIYTKLETIDQTQNAIFMNVLDEMTFFFFTCFVSIAVFFALKICSGTRQSIFRFPHFPF